MLQEMSATARLQEGLRFEVEASSGHFVALDMIEHVGDKSGGFSPMEMLLVGLAGCTGMSVLSILRKRRQEVTGYELHVHGKRTSEHPQVFVEISVEHRITGQHVRPELVARAIELSEQRYCGVEAMLGKTARLSHVYKIVE